MAFALLGHPKQGFFDSSGSPLASGTLAILDPADDTNKASYPTADDADAATNANVNPIVLDARGEAPNGLFGLDGEDYKLVLKDSAGAPVWTVDDILVPIALPYLQTTAEAAASVTPTDVGIPPGNVLRYGTNTTPGTTDMQAAIQAAIDQAGQAGGSAVYIPAGRYLTGSALTGTSDIFIYGDGIGKSIIEPNGSFIALTLGNSTAAATTTTTSATAINVGDQSFGLTSAASVTAGQIIKFTSGTEWYYETGKGFSKGEIHVIESMSGSTVRLFDSVYDSYAASETMTVNAYSAVKVDLQDFEILCASNTTTGALVVQYAVDSFVTRIKVSGNNKAAMGTIGCVGVIFNECISNGANDSTNGFGVSITDSNNVLVTNHSAENCGFGVDLGTGSFPCRNNSLTDSIVIGGGFEQDGTTLLNTVSVGAECHGAAENISFINNRFVNCYRGVLVKGSNVTISDNKFINCIFECVYFQRGANLSVTDNRVVDFATDRVEVGSGATSTFIQRPERFLTVEGSTVSASTDLHVQGNTASCESRFIQVQGTDTFSNWRIIDNHVDLYGQTGGTAVIFFGGGAFTLSSGRVTGNTWNVEQGTFTEVQAGIIGVPTKGFTTATNVIGPAETGATFYLNAVGGFTSTLPAPEPGLKYTFIVSAAPTGASYIITTNGGDNVLYGTFLDIVGELTYFSAQDTFNFVLNKAVVGDRLEVETDGTNWHCKAFSGVDGGITVAVT